MRLASVADRVAILSRGVWRGGPSLASRPVLRWDAVNGDDLTGGSATACPPGAVVARRRLARAACVSGGEMVALCSVTCRIREALKLYQLSQRPGGGGCVADLLAALFYERRTACIGRGPLCSVGSLPGGGFPGGAAAADADGARCAEAGL
ncbi:hypothetical protein WJX73_006717 [Symbiochloris irregularis]|uniref:Uncharacterized protein n=1 Tax=Symbiochloris irregularis TaxID=706552 RepID=A0AAW1NS77_9CHLO